MTVRYAEVGEKTARQKSRKEDWYGSGTSCGWTLVDCRNKSCILR